MGSLDVDTIVWTSSLRGEVSPEPTIIPTIDDLQPNEFLDRALRTLELLRVAADRPRHLADGEGDGFTRGRNPTRQDQESSEVDAREGVAASPVEDVDWKLNNSVRPGPAARVINRAEITEVPNAVASFPLHADEAKRLKLSDRAVHGAPRAQPCDSSELLMVYAPSARAGLDLSSDRNEHAYVRTYKVLEAVPVWEIAGYGNGGGRALMLAPAGSAASLSGPATRPIVVNSIAPIPFIIPESRGCSWVESCRTVRKISHTLSPSQVSPAPTVVVGAAAARQARTLPARL